MLSFPASVRVFVARECVDMRKSFDGLSALVMSTIKEDPESGHLFVFFNRRRDLVKCLVWDCSGYWVLAKRLEHGVFHIFDRREGSASSYEMRSADLMLILEGIDLRGAKRRLSHDEICRKS
jgi:transposase